LIIIQTKKENFVETEFSYIFIWDYLLLAPPISEKHRRSGLFITRTTRKRETFNFYVQLMYKPNILYLNLKVNVLGIKILLLFYAILDILLL